MQKQSVIRAAAMLFVVSLTCLWLSACSTVISGVGQPGPDVGMSDQVEPGHIGSAMISATRFKSGDTVVVTVRGTTAGALSMRILPAPAGMGTGQGMVIGQGTVIADGTGTASGRIPATGFSGQCELVAYGDTGGEIYAFLITVLG